MLSEPGCTGIREDVPGFVAWVLGRLSEPGGTLGVCPDLRPEGGGRTGAAVGSLDPDRIVGNLENWRQTGLLPTYSTLHDGSVV